MLRSIYRFFAHSAFNIFERNKIKRLTRERNEAREQRAKARAERDQARLARDEARRERDEIRAKRQISHKAIDIFKIEQGRSEMRAKLDPSKVTLSRTDSELFMTRLTPPFNRFTPMRTAPTDRVAFATIANAKFLPGLEGLLLSLLDVYPGMSSDVHVYHDGSLGAFTQARLRRTYPNIHLHTPDMSWLEDLPSSSDNHKRIGVLGYMNVYALLLDQYDHVVILDSDMLILDDISAFWQGDGVKVVYDCGARDYCVRSEYTGAYVFNSGAIGLPKQALGKEKFEEIKGLARTYASAPVCPTLDRFADQKIWNIHLKGADKTYLPINYNCNIKYYISQLGHFSEGVSVLHFTGPKPWTDTLYVNSEYVGEKPDQRQVHFPSAWLERYRNLLFRHRSAQYRLWAETDRRRTPRKAGDAGATPTCLLIGNGPSLARTDLSSCAGVEKFVFNWFILNDKWDEIAPDHLMLASHMFFGGWNTQDPKFPDGYLEKLLARKHRPALWVSFYFREYLEMIGLHKDFEINYVLFEKPFKRFVDNVGNYSSDIDSFRDDARTGVLTMGVPAAVSMGFKRLILVGCDSNYNQTAGAPKYFYDMSQHTSLETREEMLTSTWTEEGRGQFSYKLVHEALTREGIEFWDATVGGALRTVPRTELANLIAPAERQS